MSFTEFVKTLITIFRSYFRRNTDTTPIQSATAGDLWVMAGPSLERTLEAELTANMLSPRVLLLVGLPGCGKTYVLSKLLHRLKKIGKIRDYVEIFGTPSKTAAVLLEDELILDQESKVFVSYRCSQIRKAINPDFMLPCDKYTREEAMAHFERHPQEFVWIWVDEATRFREIFFNEAMVPLSDCKYIIDNKAYYLPVRWALSGNPSGMSGSCAVFDSAVLARINKRFNVYQADLDTLTDVIIYPLAYETGKLNGVSVQYEQVRVACAISILTWGFPLDRRALAYVSDRSKRLMNSVAAACPEAAKILRELGKWTDFGTDGRKPIHWCEGAIIAARVDGVNCLQTKHFVRTAASCIAHGGKDNFTEGASPEIMKRKAELITRLAEICFSDANVRALILNAKSSRQIAQSCGSTLFTNHRAHDELRNALDSMFKCLEEARYPVELRRQVWSKFLDLVRPESSELDLQASLRDVGIVDIDGCFSSSGEQEFLINLGAIKELTPSGKLIATMVRDHEGRLRPVALRQQLDEAVIRFPILKGFDESLFNTLMQERDLARHALTICECISVALNDSVPWESATDHQVDLTSEDDDFIGKVVLTMLRRQGLLGGNGALEGLPTRKFFQALFNKLHDECDESRVRIRNRLKTIGELATEFVG